MSASHELGSFVSKLRPHATDALLMSFEVSLPFVERAVIPALGPNLRNIDILVDARAFAECTWDGLGAGKAGVSYRPHVAKTKNGFAFHPKLILLTAPDALHALVMSANLSGGGWQRNLEVVDAMTLVPGDLATGRASLGLRDFLRRLPAVLTNPSPAMLSALDRAEAALPASALPEDASPDLVILHSVDRPLFAQLTEIMPANLVDQVTIFSPFFDRSNAALTQFAKHFDRADLRVVKEGSLVNDFDGESFAALGRRCTLHRICWPEKGQRRLHAKCILLEGRRDAWLVTGSANMSEAGWLHAAVGRGNIELVTARHASGRNRAAVREALGVDALIGGLDLEVIDPASHVFHVTHAVEEEQSRFMLLVYEATETSEGVSVRWVLRGLSGQEANVELRFFCGDLEYRQDVRAEREGDVWRVLLSQIPAGLRELLEEELSVAVQVRQQDAERRWHKGAAWLHRDELLAIPNDVREQRRRLRLALAPDATPQNALDAMLTILDLARTGSNAFDLGALPEARRRPDGDRSGGSSGSTGHHDELAEVSRAEAPMAAMRRALREMLEPSARTSRKGNSARPVAEPDFDHDSEELDIDDDFEDGDPIGENEEVEDLAEVDPNHEWIDACEGFIEVARTISADADKEHARRNGNILIFLCDYTVRLEWTAVWPASQEVQAAIRRAGQVVWDATWSLRGWETGSVDSAMVGALLDPARADLIREILVDPNVTARILVSAGAKARLDAGRSAPDAALILQLAAGAKLDPTAEPLRSHVEAQVRSFVASARVACADADLLMRLPTPALSDTDGWRRVERWLPLHTFIEGKADSERALAACPQQWRGRLSALLRRPGARARLAHVSIRGGMALCGGCETRLPIDRAQGQLGDALCVCENCHRLLIPIDLSASLAQKLISMNPQDGPSQP